MRKLIVSNLITLDGYYAGTSDELDWHNADPEFDVFAAEQLETMGAILFGRVTYEMMSNYWHTPAAIEDDPAVAHYMNSLPKFVASKTLDTVQWGKFGNVHLLSGGLTTEINALKRQDGKDIVIFGSGKLMTNLTRLGLIDEYRLLVHPTLLGSGKPMFPAMGQSVNLKLIDVRAFNSGTVLLRYQRQ